jgi:hypothetical protein
LNEIFEESVAIQMGVPTSANSRLSDQIKNQPHGGVLVVGPITITEDQGMQGSGAFDVEVDDWGDYEDIPLDGFM